MSSELKEETLNALKTGINFLEEIKATICNNDVTNKLDKVYYVFEELLKKWEIEVKTEKDCKPKNNNLVKLSNSAPMKPTKKVEIEKRMSGDIKPMVKDMINKNNNMPLITAKESNPYKKEKRTAFQQFRSRSRSEDNVIDPQQKENKAMKKRTSILDLMRLPMLRPKDADEDQYLSVQGIDPEMIMHSDKSNFCKVTKIKLKVNNRAIGARYCCLLDKNVVLGRELNDQVAEYALDLSEYRLENRKNQYFELVKNDITHSFRFDMESESADWYHSLNKIIDSAVYSYVPVNRSYNQSLSTPTNHKAEGEKENEVPYPTKQMNDYEYPEFLTKRKKEMSRSNDENLASPVQTVYTEVHHRQPRCRISLPPDADLTPKSSVKNENIRRYGMLCEDQRTLNRAKMALKPKNKLMKDRSMSM